MRLEYVAKEQRQVLDGDRDELRRIKNELSSLNSVPRPRPQATASGAPSNPGAARARGALPQNNNDDDDGAIPRPRQNFRTPPRPSPRGYDDPATEQQRGQQQQQLRRGCATMPAVARRRINNPERDPSLWMTANSVDESANYTPERYV